MTNSMLLGAALYVTTFLVVSIACSAAMGCLVGVIAWTFDAPFLPAAIGGAIGSFLLALVRLVLRRGRS